MNHIPRCQTGPAPPLELYYSVSQKSIPVLQPMHTDTYKMAPTSQLDGHGCFLECITVVRWQMIEFAGGSLVVDLGSSFSYTQFQL